MENEIITKNSCSFCNYHTKNNSDYIKNYEETSNIINDFNKSNQKQKSLDDIYNEIQTPLLLTVLYFLFQLPFFRNFLFKYLPFLFSNDGNFNIYDCSRKDGIKLVNSIPNTKLGWKFSMFGEFADSIRKEDHFWGEGGLVYPGKLMGLASYGNVREEWLEAFDEFYDYPFSTTFEDYYILKNKLNFPDTYSGQIEFDIVATAQRAFELSFEKNAAKYYKDQPNLLLSGGCALNILNNQRLAKERNVFVPPNPHDGGLSLGMALDYLIPQTKFNATFMGPEVWDKHNLMEYVEKYKGRIISYMEIAEELLKGKIIGVVRGRSELGPRALGHRSIICHAAAPDMKDILNQKVKNREFYRPFAPICRRYEMYTFFDMTSSSHEHMALCPTVKEKYREVLKSITHVDGTARLQTTDEHQSPEFYHILANMSQLTEYPVLLNTSFNIAGKPILNTYRDAIWMLENTQMDGLILEDYYITK
jgi:carbamoyltransferase